MATQTYNKQPPPAHPVALQLKVLQNALAPASVILVGLDASLLAKATAPLF